MPRLPIHGRFSLSSSVYPWLQEPVPRGGEWGPESHPRQGKPTTGHSQLGGHLLQVPARLILSGSWRNALLTRIWVLFFWTQNSKTFVILSKHKTNGRIRNKDPDPHPHHYSIYSSATDIKFPGIAGNRQQFKFSTAVSAPAVLQPQSNLNLIHQPRKSQGYCKSK